MTLTAEKTHDVEPFSLRDASSLIEKAWPTSKISAETQKERKAGSGQTLTGLGSYWKGRKPLILTRACVLAALMPATDDLERDVEIFEKLMGMADETFGRRYMEGPTSFGKIFPGHAEKVTDDSGRSRVWRNDLEPKERQRRIARAFMDLPYAERVLKVKRPEEISECDLLDGVWDEVNAHLGTCAASMPELVEQLGIMRFGRRPKFADTFCGSGSIPFEAARMGCDAYASDLNPVACMLTWGAFNVVGAAPEDYARMKAEQERIVSEIDREICAMGVEHDSDGNRGKVYLYCLETRCPWTGWMVPMAPSWVISKKRNVIARLVPDHAGRRYDIEILTGVSDQELAEAAFGTVREGRLHHPELGDDLGIAIKEIRGDYKDEGGVNRNRLRPWEITDIRPREGDIWQERLYAIQWMDAKDIASGKSHPRTWFAAPTEEDLAREEEVAAYVERNLVEWQASGIVPDMEIEPGNKTDEPIRTRGWTHWHHLFNPRHLLVNAVAARHAKPVAHMNLGLAKILDFSGKMTNWANSLDKVNNSFSNQALNTNFNYPARGWSYCSGLLDVSNMGGRVDYSQAASQRAADIDVEQDLIITDPPYADAVQYDEITEFFIAWLRKNPPVPFDEWIWDSRRNLAIKGDGQSFKTSMVEAYRAMADHMSENGLQIVQFTHQDAKTWSDMAQIFWGAGLQVVQDWYVSTEAMSGLKVGGYVQGTHMIVLKKRQGERSGYADELVHEIRDEVKRQINEMTGLNDRMGAARGENIFNDADLQMAGYAAALRVLTAYTRIDGTDMTREVLRPRRKNEKTIVDELTEFAVQTANEFLVPDGLDRDLWLDLNGAERFHLKMMDIEEAGEAKLDQFQNFAKAFRVGDYDDMMASKAPNNARLKIAKQLGKAQMAEGAQFGKDSLVRLALRGVWRVGKGDEADDVIEELRDLVPDYIRKREALIAIARYVAEKRADRVPDEAAAARILATAIQTERI